MTSLQAIDWMTKLVGFSLIIQSAEYFALRRQCVSDAVWSWEILQSDYSRYFRKMVSLFLNFPNILFVIFIQFCFAMSLLFVFEPKFWMVCILFITSLLLSMRWRGTFNGGGDKMTMVSLIGLLIAYSDLQNQFHAQLALWFIVFQSASSYFFAGLAKLKQNVWLKGHGLQSFLIAPLYPIPLGLKAWSEENPAILKFANYFILIFECLFPLALFFPMSTKIFLGLAILFHLANFAVFGLNRFVFSWIATYPALFYISQ
ncbi:MAG: HTTM domain-containing protein [Pseudobdellovibrionaceae bacterium]